MSNGKATVSLSRLGGSKQYTCVVFQAGMMASYTR